MARHEIKKFVQDPICAECEANGIIRHVKGWGKAQCDNCGRTICRHHRDYASYFECKNCKEAKRNFLAPAPNQAQASSEKTLKQMKTADILFNKNDNQANSIVEQLKNQILE